MAPAGPPARIAAAVALLDPRPGERVLEFGCGPGVALALVAERLGDDGLIVGIDRSATAIERATGRNAAALAAGRAKLHECALADFDAPPGAFDAAFAVNVNLFWTSPAERELAVLARVLRPAARFHLLYDMPGGQQDGVGDKLARVAAAVAAHSFERVETARLDGAVAVSATNAR